MLTGMLAIGSFSSAAWFCRETAKLAAAQRARIVAVFICIYFYLDFLLVKVFLIIRDTEPRSYLYPDLAGIAV